MCAIFGWSGSDANETLIHMAESLRHRGPDGEGYFYESGVAIGMTRLAINDLVEGQQPFHSNDKSISAFCNGEVYNFQELKRELIKLGHRFQTECDCEIIPAAYQQWGRSFLQKLNGMFSIALYDHRSEQLILARDRSGQKPLYYCQFKDNIYFASEIRALHKIGLPKAINHSALPAYLSLRYVPEPETMFSGVKILPAGSLLILNKNNSNTELEKWFQLPEKKIKHSEPIKLLHSITESSIHSALLSDVPIALHLSAGIDSSIILAEIQNSGKSVHAITAGFGAYSDEVAEAARMCEKYQVNHTAVMLDASDISSLPRVVSQMELPVGDALILAFDKLAEVTAGLGCKVAMGGEGIDEIFAGYSFHKFMKVSEMLGGFGRALIGRGLGITPSFLLDKCSSFPAALGASGKKKIQDYLLGYGQLSDYEKGVNLRTLFSEDELKSLSDLSLHDANFSSGDDLFQSHLKYQFDSWLQDWAIIRQERNTMAHSVEYRMPFLDHRLVEFGFSLDNKYKISGLSGKDIWRKMAARYYPDTLSKRAKQPFFFPTEEAEYYKEITKLLDATVGSDRFINSGYFDADYLRELRARADRTREFLPIKQLLSLAILDLWMQEHDLSF